MNNIFNILLRNGYMPPILTNEDSAQSNTQAVGTILSNLAYFGFMPNSYAMTEIQSASSEDLRNWWRHVEPELKSIYGEDRNMGDSVVYRNFPDEVMEMELSVYWIRQCLMYLGLPNEMFTTEPVERPALFEDRKFKVLARTMCNVVPGLFLKLLSSPVKWTPEQESDVFFLAKTRKFESTSVPFKENLARVAVFCMNTNPQNVVVRSATDVMRIASAMSSGDEKPVFKFRRPERRFLLKLLENTSSLEEDMARDTGKWKRLAFSLRPGDYRSDYPRVYSACSNLFEGNVKSFNSKVEAALSKKDAKALSLLKSRPGDFVRRLQHVLKTFGNKAVGPFKSVLGDLTVIQLLKIESYLRTASDRKNRLFAPKGNWSRLQMTDNKVSIDPVYRDRILSAISKEIKRKVGVKVNLDPGVSDVKLQTSDSVILPYGRGTSFPIPENVKFIRSASHWKSGNFGANMWFDNSWNFFDGDWSPVAACCWTDPAFKNCAVFSGDPTSGKDLLGRGCQIIDLYPEKLVENGVRYAVWSILSFNRISFSESDVFAALQWGEEPKSGELFEPSRCQISFPLTDKALTKYVAMVDLQERKLVYLDANLKSSVHSAHDNSNSLKELLPAYMEYVNGLPSVHDLFRHQTSSKSTGIPIMFSDESCNLETGSPAFVFQPQNPDNDFKQIDLMEILNRK